MIIMQTNIVFKGRLSLFSGFGLLRVLPSLILFGVVLFALMPVVGAYVNDIGLTLPSTHSALTYCFPDERGLNFTSNISGWVDFVTLSPGDHTDAEIIFIRDYPSGNLLGYSSIVSREANFTPGILILKNHDYMIMSGNRSCTLGVGWVRYQGYTPPLPQNTSHALDIYPVHWSGSSVSRSNEWYDILTWTTRGGAGNLTQVAINTFNGSSVNKSVFDPGEPFFVNVSFSFLNGDVVPGADCNLSIDGSLIDGLNYNSSTETFILNHSLKYFEPGSYSVVAQCNKTNDSLFSGSNHNFIIRSLDPVIVVDGLNNSLGDFSLPGNVSFAASPWYFFGSVHTHNLSWVYQAVSNSSSIILSDNQSGNFSFSLNGSYFADFKGNNFSYVVKGGNAYGNFSNVTHSFTVIDEIFPFCSGLTSVDVDNNTDYVFNIHCVDESFFSLNLSATNGFNHYIKDINAVSFDYHNSTLITMDTTISYEYCDGHTREELKQDSFHKLRDKKVTFNTKVKGVFRNVSFYALNSVPGSVEVRREKDRISFDFKFKDTDPRIKTFIYESSEDAVYVDSDLYDGWIISPSSRTWFDAELIDDPDAVVTVERVDTDKWLISIDSKKDTLHFSSIGELNCVDGNYLVSVIVPVTGIKEFKNLTELFYYFGMTLFWFVCVLALFMVKGVHGGPVQVFNVMQFLLGFWVSLMWLSISVILFFVVLGPAIVVFFGFLKRG